MYDALIYLALRLFKLSEPWLKMMSGNNDNFDLSKGMAWPEIVAFSILMIVINNIAILSSMVTINADITCLV